MASSKVNFSVGIAASHCEVPPLDGGSIRSYELFKVLERRLSVELMASRCRISAQPTVPCFSAPSSKLCSFVRAYAFRGHYIEQKVLSGSHKKYLREHLKRWDATVSNFVWGTGGLWPAASLYVDTHNSEIEWFRGIFNSSKSRLVKRVCIFSLRRSIRLIKAMPPSTVFLHVSDSDAGWYRRLRCDCGHVIVPNGCTLRGERKSSAAGQPLRAYFLGSLSAKMNADALHYFADNFWGTLKGKCVFEVYGSNPPSAIRDLCAHHGWSLGVNLPDDDLNERLSHCSVAVMPFAYSAGSKLKFFDALGRGMNVLATAPAAAAMDGLPHSVCVADNPSVWARKLDDWKLGSGDDMLASINYAKRFTWTRIFESFLDGDSGELGQAWRLAAE